MCNTRRAAAMPVVALSAGMKRTRRWVWGGGGMLQDHEWTFQPPVTRLASVEQQEPKQAGSEVTDVLFQWRGDGVVNLSSPWMLLEYCMSRLIRSFKIVLPSMALSLADNQGPQNDPRLSWTVVGFISSHKYLNKVFWELLQWRKHSTRDAMCSRVFTF